MNQKTKAATDTEAPRYRLTEKSFLSGVRVKRGRDWVPMDDVLLDPEAQPLADRLSGPHDGTGGDRLPIEIEFEGIPGHHMVPLNDAAKAMVKKYGVKQGNPIDALTVVGPGATVLSEVRDSV